MSTTASTITVRILSVVGGESLATLPSDTLAVRPARFESLFRAHHGEGAEVRADVSTDTSWAGSDAEVQSAHEALVSDLFDSAARLDAMDTERPCYVLFEGDGADGEDVWSRCEIVGEDHRESEVNDDDEPAQHVVIAGETFGVDTAQQIREARAAMIRNGVAEAVIYAGSAPDAVRTRLLLFACPASIVVSPNNGATTEAITGDASAAIFLDRYGMQNAVSTLRDHDLPTEEYDGAFALLAALDACCVDGEVPTLP